jgi:hypothetical protein
MVAGVSVKFGSQFSSPRAEPHIGFAVKTPSGLLGSRAHGLFLDAVKIRARFASEIDACCISLQE